MLKELFGSQTAEKILLYLIAQGQGYPLEIANAFKISNTQVLRTLHRLEQSDILVGQNHGRTRLYSLNPRWFLARELELLLKKALIQIPLDKQEQYFVKRGKPRKKGKPL
jgi:predicted ArsR family transcriptional regulator